LDGTGTHTDAPARPRGGELDRGAGVNGSGTHPVPAGWLGPAGCRREAPAGLWML